MANEIEEPITEELVEDTIRALEFTVFPANPEGEMAARFHQFGGGLVKRTGADYVEFIVPAESEIALGKSLGFGPAGTGSMRFMGKLEDGSVRLRTKRSALLLLLI